MPAAALGCVLGAATPAQGAQESMPQRSAKRAAEHAQPATHELPRWLRAAHTLAPAWRLQAINHLFNTTVEFAADPQVWGPLDHRACPPEALNKVSFDSAGPWQGAGPVGAGDPALRLSRWCEVMAECRAEGLH